MNKLKIFILTLILLSFTLPLYAQKLAGTVIALNGKAWVEIDGRKETLQLKSKIFEKNTLITDTNGRLKVLFIDDSVLLLGSSTTIKISNFSFGEKESSNMAIHIAKGITRVVSGKIVKQNPDKFKITSPLATIGIRGTITMHDVKAKTEQHFVESLGKGHNVLLKGRDGGIVTLHSSLTGVDLQLGKATPKNPRPQTWKEQKAFKDALSLTFKNFPQQKTNRQETAGQNSLRQIIDSKAFNSHIERSAAPYETFPGANGPTPGATVILGIDSE